MLESKTLHRHKYNDQKIHGQTTNCLTEMAYVLLTVHVCIPEEKCWTLDQDIGYSDRRFVWSLQRARANPEFLLREQPMWLYIIYF